MGTGRVASAGTTAHEDGGRAGAPSQKDRDPTGHAELPGELLVPRLMQRVEERLDGSRYPRAGCPHGCEDSGRRAVGFTGKFESLFHSSACLSR